MIELSLWPKGQKQRTSKEGAKLCYYANRTRFCFRTNTGTRLHIRQNTEQLNETSAIQTDKKLQWPNVVLC